MGFHGTVDATLTCSSQELCEDTGVPPRVGQGCVHQRCPHGATHDGTTRYVPPRRTTHRSRVNQTNRLKKT